MLCDPQLISYSDAVTKAKPFFEKYLERVLTGLHFSEILLIRIFSAKYSNFIDVKSHRNTRKNTYIFQTQSIFLSQILLNSK